MALTAQHLVKILEQAQRPVGVKELLRLAGLHPGEQTEVKRVLRECVRAGQLAHEGKRYSVPRTGPAREQEPRNPRPGHREGTRPHGASKASTRIEGFLHIHRDGFGFVHPLSGEGDNLYLPESEARQALDHDRVLVERINKGGRTEGRIVSVLDRPRAQVVGVYAEQSGRAHVVPNDTHLPGVIQVPRTQLAQPGDLVKVRLGIGADLINREEGLFGEVSGSLGKPGDPSAEVLSIVFSQGFSDEFPAEVMDAANLVPLKVSPHEAAGENRKDLRALSLVTIDGEDARDFDDAVYAERHESGYRLWVAIADVSHYVREGTPLDVEALRRATSVYLPNRVLPMLPERLSAGICSLRPDEDRLCMVAEMDLDARGKTTRRSVYAGVMRSAARCTYEEVQAVLDGNDVPHRNGFKPQFELLLELSKTLLKMREARGALDFDLPESKVVVDASGVPTRMEKRERKQSHRLIEECMLAANEAVAKYFQDQGLPTVYRYHGAPDPEKLATFAALAQAYGFELKAGAEITSRELSSFLERLEGHPERRALNQLLLRSMMQAVYSAENVGHYGLAAEHYLHFTSPIRRYPDLLVHRLLKQHWARGKKSSERELERQTEQLDKLAAQSSERERAAMQVEREVVSFYSALLMKDRVGEEFAATVSSVVDFGFFVELDSEGVEGLVRGETLGSGFKLDTKLHALVYPTGRRIRVGHQLIVKLSSVNLPRRQLDFAVLSFAGEKTKVTQLTGEEEQRNVQSRRRPPPPQRSQATHRPHVQAEPDETSASVRGSPHPGFDRLRALASKKTPAQTAQRHSDRNSKHKSSKPERDGKPPSKKQGDGRGKPGQGHRPRR